MNKNEIVEKLKKAAYDYYNKKKSSLTDEEYDKLYDELKRIDPENDFFKEVGSYQEGMVQLPFKMGTLKKVKYDNNALEKWLKIYTGNYIISDKLDGVSAQIYKNKNGESRMYTRGTYTEGKDITKLLKYIRIGEMENGMSIRGELIISKEDFKNIEDMDNIRNTVAGIVNSKKVNEKNAKYLQFVAYTIIYPKYKQIEQLKILEKRGFKVVTYEIHQKIDNEMLKEYLIDRRVNGEFEIDGIVCTDNGKIYENDEIEPKHSVAFKAQLDDQMAEAKVIDVIWDVTMDGYLKPVIKINPVNLVGVVISNATAHNAKYIVDNKIGIGAEIIIIRSNDVIPYILKVIKPAKEIGYPLTKYKWNKTKVDFIVDDDTLNQGINVKRIGYFFKTIKVKHLSEETILKMVENGFDTIIKILKADKNVLYKIKGLGEKSIDKIYKNIEVTFTKIKLGELMSASHIFGRGLGTKKINQIINMYPDILTRKITKDELLNIDGFGNILADLFLENYDKFMKFYNEIGEEIDLTRFENIIKKEKGEIFKDQVIVMTGFRDRELEQKIIDNGGEVTTAVSKNTTLVICNNLEDTSKKLEKAKELGIKIITLKNFKELYNIE